MLIKVKALLVVPWHAVGWLLFPQAVQVPPLATTIAYCYIVEGPILWHF